MTPGGLTTKLPAASEANGRGALPDRACSRSIPSHPGRGDVPAGSSRQPRPQPIATSRVSKVKSIVPHALSRAGRLPAANAVDGMDIVPGRVYIAPPDHHVLLGPGRIRVTRGPQENRFRSAVDPLFRSAAYAFGPRVVGVVVTGVLDDGTVGLCEVKARGGVAVVRGPAEAQFFSIDAQPSLQPGPVERSRQGAQGVV
ncbi:MAG: hypothetical protein JO034_17005 [Singulisphaera sp.]|nr:hypothetical protein [Singulisphaera sp.]